MDYCCPSFNVIGRVTGLQTASHIDLATSLRRDHVPVLFDLHIDANSGDTNKGGPTDAKVKTKNARAPRINKAALSCPARCKIFYDHM